MTFPDSNLPPSAQPWAQEVQDQIDSINAELSAVKINDGARDAQIRANYQTTGVTQNALEETLTYLRGLSFRYATFESNANWVNQTASTTDTTISGTEFYINLERRPKAASAFITVTCDVDLSCKNGVADSLMSQIVSQYIYIQSYAGTTGNPWGGAHGSTNVATGQYSNYLLAKSNTKSGIKTSDANTFLLGGSNITTTAGVYLNPAYAYRVTTRLSKYTAPSATGTSGSDTARYGGNVSPQSMTIQIMP